MPKATKEFCCKSACHMLYACDCHPCEYEMAMLLMGKVSLTLKIPLVDSAIPDRVINGFCQVFGLAGG